MGVAYFLVSQPELENADSVTDIDGKCLASASMMFEESKIYEKLGITPLEDFIGGSGLDIDDEDLGEIASLWFEPEKGLETIVAMKSYVSENSNAFENLGGTIADLAAMEGFLQMCIEQQSMWCLGIDF